VVPALALGSCGPQPFGLSPWGVGGSSVVACVLPRTATDATQDFVPPFTVAERAPASPVVVQVHFCTTAYGG
jgi:hypothetical protein